MYFVLLYIVLSASLVYVCICGPSPYHRDGVVGRLHILLLDLPSHAVQLLCTVACCSRRKGVKYGRLAEHYLCERRNPLVQLIYLGLTAVAVWVWYTNVFPGIPDDSVHVLAAPVATALCLSTFFVACAADPGVITLDNVDGHMELFAFDDFLYSKRVDCTTCQVPRPPRSKHCRICDKCVARFDHHCAWLNGDVGLNNYRFFMLFLISHVALCTYGCYLCVFVLWRVVVVRRLLFTRFLATDGTTVPATPYIVFLYLLQKYTLVIGIFLFMLTLGVLLLGFFGYHAYLVSINMTSNETFKWTDAQEALEERGDEAPPLGGRRHAYDRGFVRNWLEVIFPPKPRPPSGSAEPSRAASSPEPSDRKGKRPKKKQQ